MNKNIVGSQVFKKFVMGVTGLALVGFVITHLLGNILLYSKEGGLFNEYAHKLAGFGALLYVAEIGLAAFFLFHAITGIRLALSARAAKPVKYAGAKSKGGESHWGVSSNNMVITGTLLLVFLVLHVKHLKFGPGISDGYVAQAAAGGEMRDLHRYVYEQFKNPLVMGLYVAVMIALATHLKHGVWSALQSLGLTRENNTKKLYLIGSALGLLLGVGFLLIPIYIYFLG